MKLLQLTRRLAALQIKKNHVRQLFGLDAWDRCFERFDLLVEQGLLAKTDLALSLTPRGMFFADSIAGFLAESRWQAQGNPWQSDSYNDNRRGFM